MVQQLIVLLLFVLALVYLARMLYSHFKPGQAGCSKGCSGCAIDLKKLEEQLKNAKPPAAS